MSGLYVNVTNNILENIGFSMSRSTKEELFEIVRTKLLELNDFDPNVIAIEVAKTINSHLTNKEFDREIFEKLKSHIEHNLKGF